MNKNLEELKQTITENFPDLWHPTEACLSTIATLLLKDNANPTALILVGQASTGKTTTLHFIKDLDGITYRSDHFTPKAFVSHYATANPDSLSDIDLLPRIKGKCLVVADLGTILGKRKEDLTESLSILTRTLDGDGLSTDSGVWGQREVTGDCMFSMCCASTPFGYKVWEVLGKFGSRLLFLKMKPIENNSEDLIKAFKNKTSYKKRKELCKNIVHKFLKELWKSKGGFRSVEWHDEEIPNEVLKITSNLAYLLAKLRGIILQSSPDIYGTYQYQQPLIEAPHRIMSLLLNIGKGRALIYDRNQLSAEDLPLLINITLDSCPADRGEVFRELIKKENNTLSTSEICNLLNISHKTALILMESLKILGLVQYCKEKPKGAGRPEKIIKLHSNLSWLLSPEFKELFSKIDGVEA